MSTLEYHPPLEGSSRARGTAPCQGTKLPVVAGSAQIADYGEPAPANHMPRPAHTSKAAYACQIAALDGDDASPNRTDALSLDARASLILRFCGRRLQNEEREGRGEEIMP